jgi:hypothetical protein
MIMHLLSLGLVFKTVSLLRFLKASWKTAFSITERKICLIESAWSLSVCTHAHTSLRIRRLFPLYLFIEQSWQVWTELATWQCLEREWGKGCALIENCDHRGPAVPMVKTENSRFMTVLACEPYAAAKWRQWGSHTVTACWKIGNRAQTWMKAKELGCLYGLYSLILR